MEDEAKYYISFDEVKKLLEEYGITFNDIIEFYKLSFTDEEKRLFIESSDITYEALAETFIKTFSHKITNEFDYNSIYQPFIDEINLQLLLISCAEGMLEISGTITNPQVKNHKKKIKIQASVLEKLLEGRLSDKPVNELKKDLKNLQKSQQVLDWFNENRKIGKELDYLCGVILDNPLFNEWKQRKVYSFLYDLASLSGVVEEKEHEYKGDLGKEKEDWVKSRLNSYSGWWNQMNNHLFGENLKGKN